jgi:hypothetical protein
MKVTEATKKALTAIALLVLTIGAGVAYGYFLYLSLLAFAFGLVGIKPWWTGITLVILSFLVKGPFGPIERISFVLIAAVAAVFTSLGNEARQQIVRRPEREE